MQVNKMPIASFSRVTGGQAEYVGIEACRVVERWETLWKLSSDSFCSLSERGSKVIL